MIRQATQKDIPAIRELMQSEPGFWMYDDRSDVLQAALASAGDLALVWEEEGIIVGFACAHDLGFRAYLSELIVHRSARNRGIGSRFVRHLQDVLKRRRCPVLFADVWLEAEVFYRSFGWSEPDVILLRKRLENDDGQSPV
jgi:predicted N-acetyltransferase YhbS